MKYSRNFLKKLEAALLETKKCPSQWAGICWNVGVAFGHSQEAESALDTLVKLWPKYSGDFMYPVPGGFYHLAAEKRTLWDRTTKYGRNRYELLDFLLEQVQAMIREIDEYIEEHELEYLEECK